MLDYLKDGHGFLLASCLALEHCREEIHRWSLCRNSRQPARKDRGQSGDIICGLSIMWYYMMIFHLFGCDYRTRVILENVSKLWLGMNVKTPEVCVKMLQHRERSCRKSGWIFTPSVRAPSTWESPGVLLLICIWNVTQNLKDKTLTNTSPCYLE